MKKQIFLGILSLVVSTTSFAEVKKGTILLEGKTLAVTIDASTVMKKSDSIVVGDETYQVIDYSIRNLMGHRETVTNGKTVLDKTVIINLDQESFEECVKDPAGVAQQFGLTNAKEFACDATLHNAVLLIGDNLTGKMIGNCLKL